MADIDRIDQRLAAVERVVVDGDVAVTELAELTDLSATVDSLEARLEEHERRLGSLEASVQSVEGYVGNVESVSDDVERHAASAVATVDRLERRLEVLEADLDDVTGGILESGVADGESNEESVSNAPVVERSAPKSNGERPRREPAVERSVRKLFEEDSKSGSIVDDGMDRPGSSATQSSIDSAVAGRDTHQALNRSEDTKRQGLLDSIRSLLS